MFDFISEIAKVDKQERFNAIVNVLEKNNIAYRIQSIPYFSNSLGNIIVEFNPGIERKRVVCAHYDNFERTPGANDNAAACSILLNLILALKETKSHMEFVFFDLEESGFKGSRYYLEADSNIAFAINMDMCGFGNNIVCCANNFDNALLNHTCTIVNELPGSDAYSFISKGIPTLCVVNSTDNDLNWYRTWYGTPDFYKTMHTPEDTVDTINLEQVERIYDFVKAILS